MSVRQLLVATALAATAGGCTRTYARREPPRVEAIPVATPASTFASIPPVSAPVPPTPPQLTAPPAEPAAAPAKPEAFVGIVPPIPDGRPGVIPSSPAADSAVVPAGAVVPASADADDRKPLRERMEENRQKRQERREERRDERREDKTPPAAPAMPSPYAPKDVPADPKSPVAPTPTLPAASSPAVSPALSDAAAVRKLLDAAVKHWAGVPDFEARLVKREVVAGKAMPQDEIVYRFRKQPLSVYMKTLSENGQGREVLFVKGQAGDKMTVVTGKGDNVLAGVGYKTELDPDSRMASGKSRYKIYEAGFDRTFTGLNKAVAAVEGGKPIGLKAFGPVSRPEYPYPLEGIELTLQPGQDPTMPKGGRRTIFLDPKPESPAYLMPVLVVAVEPDGREVEYYCFDRVKVPSGWADADWSPARLGKK